MSHRFVENGKEAVVYLHKEEFCGDLKTLGQIRRMVADPSVEHARIMPDCHFASSCCVGFTSHLTDRVVPRFIGGDIGCGITAYPVGPVSERVERRAKQYSDRIRALVPMGDAMHDQPVVDRLDDVCAQAFELAKTFGGDKAPSYDAVWLEDFVRRVRLPMDRILRQLGTLGGGNHFVEIGVDDTDAQTVYVTVHSGSRGLGQHVCQYHQDIITAGTRKDWDAYEKESRRFNKRVKDKTQRLEHDRELRAKYLEPSHPPYLEGEEAWAYYFDMIFAQCYAEWNRRAMLQRILGLFDKDFDPDMAIVSIHNYVDFTDRVWRKGAIRAHRDQLTVVALNMRDGLLIVKGKGNPEWNHSAPHGAGRRAARGEAARITNMKEFQESMANVYSDCVVPDTLDESPIMYKDGPTVMERSAETCEIITRVRPLINLKGW